VVEIERVVLRDEVAAVPHGRHPEAQGVAAKESRPRLVLPQPHGAQGREEEQRAERETATSVTRGPGSRCANARRGLDRTGPRP